MLSEGRVLTPCPKGRTDYEACFAPFRYCPEKGCGRAEGSVPLLYGPFEDRYAANRYLRTLPDHWQRWTVRLTHTPAKEVTDV